MRSSKTKKVATTSASTRATVAFGRAMIRDGLQQISGTMSEVDLTLTQLGTLILLQQRGAMTVSTIAVSRDLSLSATSHMLNRLVERDMIVRDENPEDRRERRISLGAAGAALLARFDAARERALARLLYAVPSTVQHELEETLGRVMAYMDGSPPPVTRGP